MNIAGAISAFASAQHSDVDYFKFLGLTGFIFSFTNVLIYLFHLDDHIPLWHYIEIGFNVLWTLLYIIGSSLMTTWGANYGCCGCSFAAFFGWLVTLLYICDLILIIYKRRALISASESDAETNANGSPPSAAWTTTRTSTARY